jgi:hypothetical protein
LRRSDPQLQWNVESAVEFLTTSPPMGLYPKGIGGSGQHRPKWRCFSGLPQF